MSAHRNNRTVLDLSKVQHGTFYWINQYGQTYHGNPHIALSVRGVVIKEGQMALPHPDYVGETLFQRANRLNLFDRWTPVVTFQLTANHNIQYTGDKAITMWKAWRAKIFGKE